MNINRKVFLVGLLTAIVTAPSSAKKQTPAPTAKVETTGQQVAILTTRPAEVAGADAVLWRDPVNLKSRDLYLGPGGSAHKPQGSFTFVKEDAKGSNPKFTVVDSGGVKWKVKLGAEARPETVASRFVWAVGFSADEEYFFANLPVENSEGQLQRGAKLRAPDGSFADARLKRDVKQREKLGTWQWRDNPFKGTRELNGLRVLMAVINNWDLKDVNNAVYLTTGEDGRPHRTYLVSDLGATFGVNGLKKDHEAQKGNLERYRQSKFLKNAKAERISFATPARPTWLALGNPHQYFTRLRMQWIGKDIPRSDAKWMGQLLARLSQKQVRDAFRAGGYSPAEVDGFSQIFEERVSTLNRLAEDGNEYLSLP